LFAEEMLVPQSFCCVSRGRLDAQLPFQQEFAILTDSLIPSRRVSRRARSSCPLQKCQHAHFVEHRHQLRHLALERGRQSEDRHQVRKVGAPFQLADPRLREAGPLRQLGLGEIALLTQFSHPLAEQLTGWSHFRHGT
jgi:hypothetical protein